MHTQYLIFCHPRWPSVSCRGFETVTYMLKGITEHEDFCGHRWDDNSNPPISHTNRPFSQVVKPSGRHLGHPGRKYNALRENGPSTMALRLTLQTAINEEPSNLLRNLQLYPLTRCFLTPCWISALSPSSGPWSPSNLADLISDQTSILEALN